MPKNYEFPENEPLKASEPAVAYHRMPAVEQMGKDSVDWNPNYPVHARRSSGGSISMRLKASILCHWKNTFSNTNYGKRIISQGSYIKRPV
ncbi:MAG: hypothetical protein LBG77_02115 [Dysgonamonadaceae bacterium]|jgi:hypothetical protein|nr:hypothetical protein [Dysgonamonadaceae bacterium]